MPSYVGNITINFNANWVGNHIVYFTLTGATTFYTSPLTVNCTALGPCSVTLDDVEYVKPSCDSIIIEGVIFPECDLEEEIPLGYAFEYVLDGDCYTTLAKCISPNGCSAFDTTLLCTKCNSVANNTIVATQSSTVPGVYQLNDYVPYESEYRFCLLSPQTFSQGLKPQQGWQISVYSNNSDPEACCYECETVQFSFSNNEFISGATRPFPRIFPMVIYTSCDRGCYRAETKLITPLDDLDQPYPPFTLCLRKGSWTVIGNEEPYVAVVTGTCSI